MKRFAGLLFTILIIITLGTVSAFAEVTEEMIPISDPLLEDMLKDISFIPEKEGSRFITDQNAISSDNVKGILFEAGYTSVADGISEYLIAAGNDVTCQGGVTKDAFMAGRTVSVTGSVGRDCYAAGQLVLISGDVNRDAYVTGETVQISGHIAGDLHVSANYIDISDGATVDGTLHYNSDAAVTAPDELLDYAEVTEKPAIKDSVTDAGIDNGSSESVNGKNIKVVILNTLGIYAVAMLLMWLTPMWNKMDELYEGQPFNCYAKAFGIGLGILAAVPVASIVLMVTGIGLRAAFVLLSVYTGALLVAPVFLSYVLGSIICRKLFKMKKRQWLELFIGTVIYKALVFIPVVSFLSSFIAIPIGVGCVFFIIKDGCERKKESGSLSEL